MTKFVKDGKLYDTKSSTVIGEHNELFAGGSIGDIKTLFMTRKGAFFLHTIKRTPIGHEFANVEPMTPDKARSWAEEHLDVEVVCRFFDFEEA